MLLIGVGNEFRGDDAIGISVMESMRKKYPELGEYIIEQSDLMQLLSIWDDKDLLIVDAIRSSQLDLGDIFSSSSADEIMKMTDVLFSTHGIDLAHVLAIGKSINKMPKSIFFIGINGKNWNIGDAISSEVIKAEKEVKKIILDYCSVNI